MKINLCINSDVGIHGVGIRPYPIIKEASKRENKIFVFCRDYKKEKIPRCRFVKPILFGKIISYMFEGFKYYIKSDSKFVTKLSRKFKQFFELMVSLRLKNGDIFHSWEMPLEAFKKAKKRGMITIKDYCMVNLEGAYKMGKLKDIEGEFTLPIREKESYKYIDYFFMASPFNYDSMLAYGVPKEKLFLVPYGVDINKFYPMKKKDWNGFRILFIGILGPRKGIPSLLEAVYLAGKKDIELILIGHTQSNIKKEIKKYKDKINIELKGFVKHDKLNEELNKADIFVFPSLRESSAKVIYEALACGLPVITTYNTGSVIEDGKQGFIVPTKEAKILKEKILFLYENPKIRKEMAKAARELAKKYTWKSYGKRVCDIYEKVLENEK